MLARLRARCAGLAPWLHSLPNSRILTGQTDENEFLPAAIEIVETPPKPAGRLIAAVIMLFFALALL